jgi:hypothetical protein
MVIESGTGWLFGPAAEGGSLVRVRLVWSEAGRDIRQVESTARLFPTGFRSGFPRGRSRGVTVAVDGFFAFVWFGWGQAAAPSWLVIPLAVGTALAAALAVTGVVITRRSAGTLPAMNDPAVRRRYGIIVGLEFPCSAPARPSSEPPGTTGGYRC